MGCGASSEGQVKEKELTKKKSELDIESLEDSRPEDEQKKPAKVGTNLPPIIFVLGGPGSGKGTQCALIKENFNLLHYSAGDLLREEVKSGSEQGKQIEEMMKNGELVPAEVTVALLKKAIESNPTAKGFLIDGFPRKIDQAEIFEREVRQCAFVLFFDCPLEAMEARISHRAQESGANVRVDDNPETLKKRFNTYIKETMPVISYYQEQDKLKKVHAIGTIEQVYENTKPLFDSL